MKLYNNDGLTARFKTYESSTTSSLSDPIMFNRVTIVTIGDEHFVEFGENPTATTNSFPIPGDSVMTFDIVKGFRVAFRAHNTNGHVSILGEDYTL
jgi:hypothetical protein